MAFSLTFTPVQGRAQNVAGVRRRSLYTITTSGADQYVTGGAAILPNQVSLGQIEAIIPCGMLRNGTSAYPVSWDPVNGKLMFFTSNGAAPAALVELANATNVFSFSIIVEVIGY